MLLKSKIEKSTLMKKWQCRKKKKTELVQRLQLRKTTKLRRSELWKELLPTCIHVVPSTLKFNKTLNWKWVELAKQHLVKPTMRLWKKKTIFDFGTNLNNKCKTTKDDHISTIDILWYITEKTIKLVSSFLTFLFYTFMWDLLMILKPIQVNLEP